MAEQALGQTRQRADIAIRRRRCLPPDSGGRMARQKSPQSQPPLNRFTRVRPLFLATSLFLSTLAGAPAFAQSTQASPMQATPSAQDEAARVVDGFMAALSNGQLEAARQSMTPDAVVIANGTVLGTRDGYIDGAAKGDAIAMKSVRSRELVHRDARLGAQ